MPGELQSYVLGQCHDPVKLLQDELDSRRINLSGNADKCAKSAAKVVPDIQRFASVPNIGIAVIEALLHLGENTVPDDLGQSASGYGYSDKAYKELDRALVEAVIPLFETDQMTATLALRYMEMIQKHRACRERYGLIGYMTNSLALFRTIWRNMALSTKVYRALEHRSIPPEITSMIAGALLEQRQLPGDAQIRQIWSESFLEEDRDRKWLYDRPKAVKFDPETGRLVLKPWKRDFICGGRLY